MAGLPKLDVRPDRVDLRDREYRPPLVSLPPAFPEPNLIHSAFSKYTEAKMILDQGQEGACTGFGLAAVINYLMWIGEFYDLQEQGRTRTIPKTDKVSPRMLYHLARVYDEWPGEDYDGSSLRGAMKGWHHHGVCRDKLWPYKKEFMPPKENWISDAAQRPLGAYYRIKKEAVADMQAAINELGAIYVSSQVHGGWDVDRSTKILPVIEFRSKNDGGHAFAMVGYNADGFIIQNSWGPRWGYAGFAVMTYRDWVKNGMDAWAAVIGAPVALDQARASVSTQSLREAGNRASFFWNDNSNSEGYEYQDKAVEPWSEVEAYHHSAVLGNDGRPLNRLIDVENANAALEKVGLTLPQAWLRNQRAPKIAVYAHGGLNDEEASVGRIRLLAPYFKANGIYPIFLTWRTGFLESITSILEDAVAKSMFGSRAEGRIADFHERVKDKLQESKDRLVEVACEQFLVKAVWTQMKQNARAAMAQHSGNGSTVSVAGGAQLSDYLAILHRDIPNLEIHLIGHSAGSIILGHMLSRLRGLATPVQSVRLFAPACTIPFANEHYKKAVEGGIVAGAGITIDLMSDSREQGDSVGPKKLYGKSLLYLVARALEDSHKTPLLGMEVGWSVKGRGDNAIKWNPESHSDIKRWASFARENVQKNVHKTQRVSDGQKQINLAHGSFDNDVDVMTDTLSGILGGRLKHGVENLRGF